MMVSPSMRRLQNLPADLTSFVGREREIAAVKRLLAKSRMITLAGTGGVGKTRVALRTASEVKRSFGDGVWLVELAALTDGALVAQTVADALRIQGLVADRSLDSLVDYLRPRHVLLLLDNCEHLVDPCAALAESILRSCPEVRILATSRQPLRVYGEHVLPVLPLPTAEAMSSQAGESSGCSPAVQLFVERAAAIEPEFVLNSRNRMAVAEICRRLDGIPLAIELAAGRLRVLSVDQLHQRLDNRFGLLTGDSPTTLPRQRTLRALIDWSFELCSPAEQLLWARLSVFRDGFELDAVESVCVDGEIAAAADVLEVLTGLVDKSVVVAVSVDDLKRYVLPETLAEYGRERLSATDEIALRRKQRDWCHRLVSLAEVGWFSGRQVDLFASMRREHANLRVALGFCVSEPREAEIGLRMASSLRFYWVLNGSMAEGRHWLDRLLAQHPVRDAARLKALRVNAHLAVLLNDYAGADVFLTEAFRLAEGVADRSANADVMQVQGLNALFQGDAERAISLLGDAFEVHQELDDRAALAYDEVQLALATLSLGDRDRALGLVEDSLRMCESSGENWTTSLAWFALSVVAARKGDQARATHAGRQSIRLRQPLGDRRNIGLNFEALAWSAALSGDVERAARLFGAAQAVEQSIGTSMRAIGYLAELHERYERVARQALGDAAFERELRVGLRSDFDGAVDYALGVAKRTAESPAEPAAEAGLTKREWEIAQLVADGMTNRAIASDLVISPRTVESHVDHILVKLNFTSRIQVAAWVAQRRTV